MKTAGSGELSDSAVAADGVILPSVISLVVATCIAEAEDAQALERCICAALSQCPPPRALWVSWFAVSFGPAASVAKVLDALSARCAQLGVSLERREQSGKLRFWEHVGDLVARQDIRVDAGSMWVQFVHVDENPCSDRSSGLITAASFASKASRFLWSPGACGDLSASGVLAKLSALADFFVATPKAALAHELCGVAFLAFANAESSVLAAVALRIALAAQPGEEDHRRASEAREREPTSPRKAPRTSRRCSSPPSPESQASMAVVPGHVARLALSYQGGTALPVGEDLARCLSACRRGGAALAMAALHSSSGLAEAAPTAMDATSLAEGVGHSFELGPAGRRWVEETVRELAQEARESFGPVLLQPQNGAW